jgi:hypothetical protein
LKGLPLEIRQEAEKNGGFWVGTGLRMPAEKYHALRETHPDLHFEVYPKERPAIVKLTV